MFFTCRIALFSLRTIPIANCEMNVSRKRKFINISSIKSDVGNADAGIICRKLSVRQLSIGTLQFRSAVDRGMIRGLCTTAVQVFDITQWNLAEDSFGVNTRSNAQRFVIDR